MNKQQLANKVWSSANKMRSKIDANEYKDYILGLIFYKFLSDNEVNYLKTEHEWTDDYLPYLVEDYSNPDMEKWITPVQSGIIATASEVIESLIKQVEALSSKYAVSYNDLNAELVTAQDELSNLISDLTGDEYAIRGLNEFKNSNEFNAMQLTSARQKGNQMRSYSAKPLARQEKSAARIAIGDSAAGRPYPQRG